MLLNEVEDAKKHISTNGYDMSIGELIGMYKSGELFIAPPYQRLFRWDHSRKVSFIESLLLGIPIPSIFVYEKDDGRWELIDGLQRISTLIQFMQEAKSDEQESYKDMLTLDATKHLPSLDGESWQTLDIKLKLNIKRARIRVEILNSSSDKTARYELFQRLNTGGANLSAQEVRNCSTIMLNNNFYENVLMVCKEDENFKNLFKLTPKALSKSDDIELVLKHFTFKYISYQNYDASEYLDVGNIELASNETFDIKSNVENFQRTFKILKLAFGNDAFKDPITSQKVKRLFDILTVILSKQIDSSSKSDEELKDFITDVKATLSEDSDYNDLGAGVGAKSGIKLELKIIEKHS